MLPSCANINEYSAGLMVKYPAKLASLTIVHPSAPPIYYPFQIASVYKHAKLCKRSQGTTAALSSACLHTIIWAKKHATHLNN